MDPLAILVGLAIGLLLGGLGVGLFLTSKRQQILQRVTQAESETRNYQVRVKEQEEEIQQHRLKQIEHQEQVLDLTRDLTRMQASFAQLNEQLNEREADLDRLNKRFTSEFEQVAGKVLDENARKLSDSQQAQLGLLLTPLQERLNAFEQRVEQAYQQEARERFSLQKEIERLFTLNQQMSEDAQNLTKALKGDSKTQGNWGELVLSRILESSGLREGEEFVVQAKDLKLKNDEGRRLQPDVIVKLPDDKHLIIDAKVSLTAYERYTTAETEAQQGQALRQHLISVTNHIQQLSDKHYSKLEGLQSPDFVLMFMPVESAFSLALQAGKDLFAYAWERRIVLVSPTTLLATLKTVASIWRLEQQNRNAEEIARQGGALYDKFVGFAEEMKKIGASLDKAYRHYGDAMGKLHEGHGSLSSRAEKLRQLGISHRKRLK